MYEDNFVIDSYIISFLDNDKVYRFCMENVFHIDEMVMQTYNNNKLK